MFNFPNSPTIGQKFTPPGGVEYTWDGKGWIIYPSVGDGVSLTPKSVVFVGDSGNFAVDPTQLSYDPASKIFMYGNETVGAQFHPNGDYNFRRATGGAVVHIENMCPPTEYQSSLAFYDYDGQFAEMAMFNKQFITRTLQTSSLVWGNRISEHARLTPDGRLLIGTSDSTSQSKLQVDGSSVGKTAEFKTTNGEVTFHNGDYNFERYNDGAIVHIHNSSSAFWKNAISFYDHNGQFAEFTMRNELASWFSLGTNPKPFTWGANGTEHLRISSRGDLMFGSSNLVTPMDYQHVEISTSAYHPLVLRNTKSAVGKFWMVGPEEGNAFCIRDQDWGGVALFEGTTSWGASSDENLKDIIEPITDGVAKVRSLRSVIGQYKSDEKKTRRSFLIAQDVEKVLPEAVSLNKDGSLELRYTEVIPLLVAAINELSARVAACEGA